MIWDKESKIRIVGNEERRAAGEAAWRHSVILFMNKTAGPKVGSGVLVQLNSHYFVATAAHNIANCSASQIIIAHEDQYSTHRPAIINMNATPGNDNDKIDVGYIEIDIATARTFTKDFLTEGRLEKNYDHCKDDWACMAGCPAELVPQEPAKRGHLFGNAITIWCDPCLRAEWPEDVDEQRDIVLDYTKKGIFLEAGREIKNPNPEGFSGAGIWRVPPNPTEGSVWSPESSKLIGLQKSWLPRSRKLFGTQIPYWLNFVSSDYNF